MKDKILLARENRLLNIKNFFRVNKENSLIVIKANIPGLNKNIPLASYLIKIFLNVLKDSFNFLYLKLILSDDGPYYLCGINGKDITIKERLVHLENNHILGRFIDLDYFMDDYKSVTRSSLKLPLRKCILCDNDAFYCIRKSNHSNQEILQTIEKNIFDYFSKVIFDLVDYSVVRELKIDNKFGLVSFNSTGSHTDMNYLTMLQAKNAILPYFQKMFIKGYQSNDLTKLLASVRKDGIEAEKAMFSATNGINCYKGIIFLLGIAVLSFGYTLKTSDDFKMIFENIKTISSNIYDDFNLNYSTFGVKLYHDYGITGIRGIAKDGFKIVNDNLNKLSVTSSDDELKTLLHHFIINTDDTVFIKRSQSYENYLKYKEIFKTKNPNIKNDILFLNNFSLKHKLSFGGSADLLIVAVFMVNLKEFFL